MLERTRKLLEYLVKSTQNNTLEWKSEVTPNGYIKYYVNIPNTNITFICIYDCFGKQRTIKMFVMQDDVVYHVDYDYPTNYGIISKILYSLAIELVGLIAFQFNKINPYKKIINDSIVNLRRE